jgi:hypothetical protein
MSVHSDENDMEFRDAKFRGMEPRNGRPGDMELGEELLKGLRRVDPPAGFAEKVLARVDAEGKPYLPAQAHLLSRIRPRLGGWLGGGLGGAIAAMLVLALLISSFALEHKQQSQKQREAQAAAQQFVLAMRITQATLQSAGRRISLRLPGGQS